MGRERGVAVSLDRGSIAENAWGVGSGVMMTGVDTIGAAIDGVGVGVSNSRIGIMGLEGMEDRVGIRLGYQEQGEILDKLIHIQINWLYVKGYFKHNNWENK